MPRNGNERNEIIGGIERVENEEIIVREERDIKERRTRSKRETSKNQRNG